MGWFMARLSPEVGRYQFHATANGALYRVDGNSGEVDMTYPRSPLVWERVETR